MQVEFLGFPSVAVNSMVLEVSNGEKAASDQLRLDSEGLRSLEITGFRGFGSRFQRVGHDYGAGREEAHER